jgi:type IV secretory pathway component VirB8
MEKTKMGNEGNFIFLLCKKNGKTKKQKNAKSKKTQKQNKRGKKGKIGKSKRETKWETNMDLPICIYFAFSICVFLLLFCICLLFPGKKSKKMQNKSKKQIEETK